MKNRSVKTASAIMVAAMGIACIVTVSAVSRWTMKRSIVSVKNAQARILLGTVTNVMEENFSGAEELVRRHARGTDLTEQSTRASQIRSFLSDHVPRYEGMHSLIYAKDSGEYFSTRLVPYPASYDPRTRPWYTWSRELVWSEPFLDYTDQEIVFCVSVPIPGDGGSKEGVTAVFFESERITEFLDTEELDDGDYLLLLSPEGRVLASNDGSWLGSDIFRDAVGSFKEESSDGRFSIRLGQDKYDFYIADVGDTGLRMMSGINTRNIRHSLERAFLAVFAVQFGLLSLLTLGIFGMIRHGVRPLEELVDLMSRAEAGDYGVRASLGNYKEISILSQQFNRMLLGIQTRDEILKHREIEIKNLAYYDPLTGLPNRTLLMKTLDRLLKKRDVSDEKEEGRGAILYLDLDGFKTVNDTVGHSVGDLVLQEVAHRISRNLRDNQTAARIGGDEFIVILEDVVSVDVIRRAASRIIETLNRPIDVGGMNYEIGASIGVVFYPTQGTASETLLKKADLAMYKAKKNGKNTYEVFEENLEEEIVVRNILETEIRRSLRERDFHFAYQAQEDIKTGAVAGFEALLRTNNPDLAAFSIEEIIAVAEETGMISAIEKNVFADGFAFLREINEGFDESLHLSVNLSSSHLMQHDFIPSFLEIVENSGANPRRINVEITESIMMKSMKTGQEKLEILEDHGIRIHLDDFGTGYSSLSYLRNLPIHCVKMDRTFIETIEGDEKNRRIVTLMVELTHSLGIQIVAEGIETGSQRELVASMGFDYGQGFLIGRPMTKKRILFALGETAVGTEPAEAG